MIDQIKAKQDFANALKDCDELLAEHHALTEFSSVDDMVNAAMNRIRDKGKQRKKKSNCL